jgi:hypothetical protein
MFVEREAGWTCQTKVNVDDFYSVYCAEVQRRCWGLVLGRVSANIVDSFVHIQTNCKEPVDQEFSEDEQTAPFIGESTVGTLHILKSYLFRFCKFVVLM